MFWIFSKIEKHHLKFPETYVKNFGQPLLRCAALCCIVVRCTSLCCTALHCVQNKMKVFKTSQEEAFTLKLPIHVTVNS